jgi:hypothetical protein
MDSKKAAGKLWNYKCFSKKEIAKELKKLTGLKKLRLG